MYVHELGEEGELVGYIVVIWHDIVYVRLKVGKLMLVCWEGLEALLGAGLRGGLKKKKSRSISGL